MELKQLYEKALKEVPINVEKIKKLKEQLDALDETFVETKKNLDGIKTDTAEEERMRRRIDDAFVFLSKDNHLEKELTKLQWEFYCMLALIIITVVCFILFYGIFLYHLKTLKLTSWCEYLPYTEAAEKSPDVGRRYRCKYLRISLKISNFTLISNTL